MDKPADGPFEAFCNELDALIDKWTDKPDDDRLTYAQIVGALEYRQFRLMQEASLSDPRTWGGDVDDTEKEPPHAQ